MEESEAAEAVEVVVQPAALGEGVDLDMVLPFGGNFKGINYEICESTIFSELNRKRLSRIN
jgi:hypothetical protein